MKKKLFGLGIIAIMAINLRLIFYWAPIESAMGIVQKIMYIHVPSVLTTYLALIIAFVCAIGYLWKRKEVFDIIGYASVEIGAVFCGLALVTGSIWGKPTWNTYWTWDARLTLTLILFLIFVGYLLLRKFTDYGEQQARLSAIVVIIGAIDIPLIHMSVVWWRTIHQTSTLITTKKNTIDKPLLMMLLVSMFAFAMLFSYLLSIRIELENKSRAYLRKMANIF